MRETYRDNDTPPQKRTHALKPKLRSWNGRVWLATSTSFQLMLKLDASLAISEIEDSDLRALSPFAAELASFALYLDYTDENHLPPAAGAQSDFVLSVIPYSLETNRLIFAITDYDLGFHNRIG